MRSRNIKRRPSPAIARPGKWARSAASAPPSARRSKSAASGWATEDPFSLFGETGAAAAGHARTAPEGRKIFNAQRRAFEALGLEADAKRADIKARFKILVKRHHPDANGGDRGSEDTLREIIQAYNYLKSAGFC